MIENSDFARPQSGLLQAGVIFEAIAEGGITRFLALYQETQPGNVGPIRSARPYFADWALSFDAGYAHVGGSPEALRDISAWKIRDLNEFTYGSSYHRITSREAPHNVYTSISALNSIEQEKGWTTSHFTGFLRKGAAPAKTPTVNKINFSISSPDYYVHYQYVPKDNAYLRWEGGAPHLDAESKKQLEPRVVIGLVMPYSLESDGYHSMYNTIGSGKAYVFQDGTVTIGTWHKADKYTNFTFTDAAGKPLALDPGQTWITALASSGEVNYNQYTALPMNYLQTFTAQFRRRLFMILLLNNLLIIGDWWLANQVFELTGYWLIIAILLVPVVSVTFVPWLSAIYFTQPMKLVGQAILHMSPDTSNIPEPNLKSIRFGRDLVKNLVTSVYQLCQGSRYSRQAGKLAVSRSRIGSDSE